MPEFPNIDYWFKKKAQRELSKIKQYIDYLEDSDYKDFFWVCFSSIIRRSSLADPKVAPPILLKEIEYLDNKQTEKIIKLLKEKQHPKPIRYFEEEINKNIRRIEEFCKALEDKTVKAKIIWDNAKTLKKGEYDFKGEINKSRATILSNVDLVITSPPYINAQKYIRSLKLELFWLDFVDNEGLHSLDRQLLGTERIQQEQYAEMIRLDEQLADSTIEEIYRINKRRAGIVGKFYTEMLTCEALAKVLKNGSFVIPTKVGIQSFQLLMNFLDSRFHGNDDFCKRLLYEKNL